MFPIASQRLSPSSITYGLLCDYFISVLCHFPNSSKNPPPQCFSEEKAAWIGYPWLKRHCRAAINVFDLDVTVIVSQSSRLKKKKKIPRNVSVLSFVSIVTIKPKSTLGDVCFAFPPLMPSTFYVPGTELIEGKRSWCLRSTQTTVGLCGDQRQQNVPTFSRRGEVQPLTEVFSSTRFPWSHPARWERRVVFLFLCLHNKYWGLRHLCILHQEWLSFRNGRLRCFSGFQINCSAEQ